MRSVLTAIVAAVISIAMIAPVGAQQQMTPPPLDFYGDLPAMSDAVLSPSGDFTAALMTVNGNRVVSIVDRQGTPIKQLVAGDAKVRGIEWVGEEAILLLRTETGRLPANYIPRKAEWIRANVIPLDDTRPVISVFAEQRNIANGITQFFGVRQLNGNWVGFFGGLRRGRTSGNRNQLLDCLLYTSPSPRDS